MIRYTILLVLVAAATCAIARDTLIADAKPGRWVEGNGIIINLSTSDLTEQYAVLAKGTNGVYSAFPAELELNLPKEYLGRVSLLTIMIADDTPNDHAPRKLIMRVQGIRPITNKQK